MTSTHTPELLCFIIIPPKKDKLAVVSLQLTIIITITIISCIILVSGNTRQTPEAVTICSVVQSKMQVLVL